MVVVLPRSRDGNRVWSTPVADIWSRWMRVLASGLLWLMRFCSSAAFWVSGGAASVFSCSFWFVGRAAFRLWRRFWFSVAGRLRLVSKYFGGAAGGGSNVPTAPQQGAAPDRLQLRSFLTSLPAAGELSRCAPAREVVVLLGARCKNGGGKIRWSLLFCGVK